jgi:hypothetical protein
MTERFTVYDIFAVLVPGVVFDLLLVLMLERLTGNELFDWQGGIGDVTALAVIGYATGAALQTVADALTNSPFWKRWRGDIASVKLLSPGSTRLSADFKRQVFDELARRYGDLPNSEDPAYDGLLREQAQRAYKRMRVNDPVVDRFLAETHQMRGHAVGLLILAVVATSTASFSSIRTDCEHIAWAAGFGLLSWLTFWRMEDKDRALGHHLWTRFTEPRAEAIDSGNV